jgi:hypothetical protein
MTVTVILVLVQCIVARQHLGNLMQLAADVDWQTAKTQTALSHLRVRHDPNRWMRQGLKPC